ncbi:MAG TPA: AlkA N-terminal domain-containing protein, partial [Desulfosarcina sp.]|nr:AlkA N-terminal domain-containing protein [Desulfosarcina sp.]
MRLNYRPPYDWDRMLAFFQDRAIPGVEHVADGVYRRSIRLSAGRGSLAVRHACKGLAVELEVCLTDNRLLMAVVERARRMFDLDANPQAIHRTLAADPLLQKRIRRAPGLRLPGSWDPFEAAIRAVVGQQISVKGAVTQLGRIVRLAGPSLGKGRSTVLRRYFPTPAELAATDMASIGMPEKRKTTIGLLSRKVASGELKLEAAGGLSRFVDTLTALPGIGSWTA